jgi:hypothetical protein
MPRSCFYGHSQQSLNRESHETGGRQVPGRRSAPDSGSGMRSTTINHLCPLAGHPSSGRLCTGSASSATCPPDVQHSAQAQLRSREREALTAVMAANVGQAMCERPCHATQSDESVADSRAPRCRIRSCRSKSFSRDSRSTTAFDSTKHKPVKTNQSGARRETSTETTSQRKKSTQHEVIN